jgi:hypothetical protein
MFFSEKHRKMLGLCFFGLVFLKFLLVKNTKTTESQHFSMLKFLDGHSSDLLLC